MTKHEAIHQFRELWSQVVERNPRLKTDHIARSEAWNNYTDSLRRDRQITAAQYDKWSNPFNPRKSRKRASQGFALW